MQDYPANLPNEYRPMSAWGYIGYNILFSIPLIGFIMMIVFAFDNAYIARRNYARSFLWIMLICTILSILFFVLILVLGGMTAFVGSSAMYY